MIAAELYLEELDKISFLKNVESRGFKFSNIVLFREYQSRLFKWKQALNFDGLDFFNKRKGYHNLFLDLSPTWINEIIPEEVIIDDLKKSGVENIYYASREYQGYFIYLYLNWEIFKSKPEIESHTTLKHPYQPVFKIISRGGRISFSTDNKFDIDHRTYLKYDNSFQLPSLDDRFLDFIDQNATDFPNQERVNQLWQRFNIKG